MEISRGRVETRQCSCLTLSQFNIILEKQRDGTTTHRYTPPIYSLRVSQRSKSLIPPVLKPEEGEHPKEDNIGLRTNHTGLKGNEAIGVLIKRESWRLPLEQGLFIKSQITKLIDE